MLGPHHPITLSLLSQCPGCGAWNKLPSAPPPPKNSYSSYKVQMSRDLTVLPARPL